MKIPTLPQQSFNIPMIPLDNLVTLGPVERGLYILPERQGNASSLVMDQLLDLLAAESETSLMESTSENFQVSYMAHRHWRRNSHIGQLIWVDSGHSFDTEQMLRKATSRGMDASRVLRAIKVGRPRTAFHYQQLLEQIPAASLYCGSPSVWRTPLVVLSDLMGPFLESDFPESELREVFQEFVLWIRHLKKRAIVLGVLKDHEIVPQRRSFYQDVLAGARWISATEASHREIKQVA